MNKFSSPRTEEKHLLCHAHVELFAVFITILLRYLSF